ncbi:hypothetical protein DEU38_101243 [Rhodococcus sp. AG1013]|nr:hypothetical protein DEU38_101243 [Rhodococcus sp. AG1013]
MLANILAAAALAAIPLSISTAPAAAETAYTADRPTAVAATQAGVDHTAPCRRWQNPQAYGHWHCR